MVVGESRHQAKLARLSELSKSQQRCVGYQARDLVSTRPMKHICELEHPMLWKNAAICCDDDDELYGTYRVVIRLARGYDSVRLWTFAVVSTSWTRTLNTMLIVAVVDWDDGVRRGSVRGSLVRHDYRCNCFILVSVLPCKLSVLKGVVAL